MKENFHGFPESFACLYLGKCNGFFFVVASLFSFCRLCDRIFAALATKVFLLTLYVPCIMFQCVDKPTRCNTSYE